MHIQCIRQLYKILIFVTYLHNFSNIYSSETIEQSRLFVIPPQFFRTTPCPMIGTVEHEVTPRGEHIGVMLAQRKRRGRRRGHRGIMLNKPTWKDSRHFESILESLCSLRIFYIYLPHATRPTSLLPPCNRRHLCFSFSPPRSDFLFLLALSCPRLRESFSSSFSSSSSSFASRRGGCTLEDGSYLRGTRSTLHRRDPVADPHPRRFDLVSPLPR